MASPHNFNLPRSNDNISTFSDNPKPKTYPAPRPLVYRLRLAVHKTNNGGGAFGFAASVAGFADHYN